MALLSSVTSICGTNQYHRSTHLSHHDVISVEGGPTVAICSFLQIYIANLSHSFRLLEEDEPLNVEEATLDLANAAPGNKGRQRVTDQVRIRIV